jgi:CheY-like chemotaxis protein
MPSAKEKGLELIVNADPPVGKKFLGDPVRLYQTFINLLSNAVKFTNAGTVKFTLQIKNFDDSGALLYFEIEDSGIGMTPEQIEKIFDPFIQADSSMTRNYGGTGLGLAITKNIIEMMGGKLSVNSSPGVGSVFNFEIAFETIDANADISGHANFDILEKPHFDGSVLICDDNAMNRQLICEHLAQVWLKAETAENGKIAVEMVEERIRENKKPFDMIFMDMFMPVMDGIEAASKITALNTGTPIVAVTANVMVDDLEKYRKNGMADCIGKPFMSQELWRVLLKYLTPVSVSAVNADELSRGTGELLRVLQINFAKNGQTLFADISEAIEAGDVKLAHRLAHTLKGNAAQIGKNGLRNIAEEIETLLSDGAALAPDGKLKFSNYWDTARLNIVYSQLKLLDVELTRVLEELQPLLDEQYVVQDAVNLLSAEQRWALFEKVKIMLDNINPVVVELLGDIRTLPGTEELVWQIENYDFESAKTTLAELRKGWV